MPQNIGCLPEMETAHFVRIKRVEFRLYFGGSCETIDANGRFEIKPRSGVERGIRAVDDVRCGLYQSDAEKRAARLVDEARRVHEFDKRRKRIRFVFGENSAAAVKSARVFGTQHEQERPPAFSSERDETFARLGETVDMRVANAA